MGIGNPGVPSIAPPPAPPSLPLMGIGNPASTPAYAAALSGFSLPLMGIGNVASGDEPARQVRLITPHGDWEPPGPGAGKPPRRHLITPHGDWEPGGERAPRRNVVRLSLPLMGIGNPARSAAIAAMRSTTHYPSWGLGTGLSCATYAKKARRLITPHGDWEPSKAARSPRPSTRSHYPSWGLGTRTSFARSETGGTDSLPLMGIGNSRLPTPGGARPSSHYPSWGLGTPRLSPGRRHPDVCSLPLMGIGNLGVAGILDEPELALITPHGDWEPFPAPPAPPAPLDLITPHGDWEPSPGWRRSMTDRSSLPLMGIGNPFGSLALVRVQDDLITPHGDWERGGLRGDPDVGPAAHYPSWGLGTSARLNPSPLNANSLPLMGIGNPARRFEAMPWLNCSLPLMGIGNGRPLMGDDPPSTHSLPLMGIGNRAPCQRARRMLAVLITPHGDWEPTHELRGTVEVGVSLPLMGIGNRVFSRPIPPVGWTHYPSWGLGTPSSAAWSRRPFRSHYPSWGLGTPRSRGRGGPMPILITPHGDWERRDRGRPHPLSKASLPLMGIGNLPAPPSPPAPLDDLITPHGDWEPVEHRAGEELRSELITPHGDWEPRLVPLPAGPRPLLITPHGDWEPATAALRDRLEACSHYPSWGLGTLLAAINDLWDSELITPHGDWEPASLRRIPRPGWTHYPSWGLGTPPSGATRPESSPNSLPLMGIGNWPISGY